MSCGCCQQMTRRQRTEMALLPAARGTWPGRGPGADPHGGATSCPDTPWATGSQLGGGGLRGATERRGVTELLCPQTPPPRRLLYPALPGHEPHPPQGSVWSAPAMEPASISARWHCHPCASSSPSGEPNKHPVAFHGVFFFKIKEQPPIAGNTLQHSLNNVEDPEGRISWRARVRARAC